VKAVGVFDRAFNDQVIDLARQRGDYHLGRAAGPWASDGHDVRDIAGGCE
jgi:hypothetical protein